MYAQVLSIYLQRNQILWLTSHQAITFTQAPCVPDTTGIPARLDAHTKCDPERGHSCPPLRDQNRCLQSRLRKSIFRVLVKERRYLPRGQGLRRIAEVYSGEPIEFVKQIDVLNKTSK